MYTIVKDYRHNEELRKSFNELAKQTFGIDFEDWYQNGYWGENYNPYSIVINNQVVANVSVNKTVYMWKNRQEYLMQLGTIMTNEQYRNKGLIRKLLEEIEKDYGQESIYLFANDSVLTFYPKFGFRRIEQYEYTKELHLTGESTIEKVPMQDQKAWQLFQEVIRKSVPQGELALINNSELLMFYVTKYMQEDVYYEGQTGAYVIAEREEDMLMLHQVFATKVVDIDKVVAAFGKEIKKVKLGFMPFSGEGYCTEAIDAADTLFVKGKAFENVEKLQVIFPSLAHA